MKTFEPDEILAIVNDNGTRDDELVGGFETPTVDFKGTYHLDQEREKWELAKDVAAFGNAGGGLIVVGVHTVQDEDRAEDVATEVKPVPKDMFTPKTIYDLIEAWVYPKPDVEVLRHPRGDDRCLGTIHVRPKSRDLPYLVTRIPDDRGKFQKNTGVGWPERGGTHTSWKPVGQIHAALQQRNPAPPTMPADPVEPTSPAAPPSELRTAVVESIDTFMGWDDRAFVYLLAHPETPAGDLPNFFGPESVADAVRRPFEIRYAGFGLTYGNADIDLDGRITSADGDGRFLRVGPNGVLEAALCAGTHFLTRGGGHDENPGPAVINPVVITEWTYLYCRFLHDHLIARAAGVWNLTIGVHEAKSRPWRLTLLPGRWTDPHGPTFWRQHANQPGKNNWHTTFRPGTDPGQDALRALAALYELFGQNYDDVGFARDGRVDPDLIISLNEPNR